MEFINENALSLDSLIGFFFVAALLYVIAQRMEEKQNETFEDRDF
jgi:hypothetical protein